MGVSSAVDGLWFLAFCSLLRGQRLRPQGFCWWFTTWWWIWFPGRCYWKILRALEAMTVCHRIKEAQGCQAVKLEESKSTGNEFLDKTREKQSKFRFCVLSYQEWHDNLGLCIKQRPGSCCCMSWVLPRAVNSLLCFHPSKSFLVKGHLARFGWRCWWTEIHSAICHWKTEIWCLYIFGLNRLEKPCFIALVLLNNPWSCGSPRYATQKEVPKVGI